MMTIETGVHDIPQADLGSVLCKKSSIDTLKPYKLASRGNSLHPSVRRHSSAAALASLSVRVSLLTWILDGSGRWLSGKRYVTRCFMTTD